MRKTFLAIASALLVLAATSCKKETENDLSNRPVRFTATIEESQNDNKTHLSGYALKWEEGDQVAVVCTGVESKALYTPKSAGKAQAEFVFAGDMADEPVLETPIKAGYPADYFSNDLSTITLPSHQNYVANSMEKFPMYGETETHGINFKNMCGVVRLRLVKPGANVGITKIAITTTDYVNGTYSVSMNSEGLPEMEHVSGGTNGDTLYCAEPVNINSATNFYIYMPAGVYEHFRIEIFDARGLLCMMNATSAITIERNKITTIAPPADKLDFSLVSGLVTVQMNPTRVQVRFASGNVQYVDNEWRIAENQYDFYKTNNVDQFCWSTTNNSYGLTTTTTGDFADWGGLFSTDDSDNPWRTLTLEEFQFARSAYWPRSQSSWTTARIWLNDDHTEYADGFVLLPDDFSAATLRNETGITVNPGGSNNGVKNTFTLEQWNTIECVYAGTFIPTRNTLNGVDENMSQYWTSSVSTDNPNEVRTWNVSVKSTAGGGTGSYPKDNRKPVRLAQNYEPLVISGSSSTELK